MFSWEFRKAKSRPDATSFTLCRLHNSRELFVISKVVERIIANYSSRSRIVRSQGVDIARFFVFFYQQAISDSTALVLTSCQFSFHRSFNLNANMHQKLFQFTVLFFSLLFLLLSFIFRLLFQLLFFLRVISSTLPPVLSPNARNRNNILLIIKNI